MSTYQLMREQTIDRPLDEVFARFTDARNLESLTPPSLRFEIIAPGGIDMCVGTIIQYALRVHRFRRRPFCRRCYGRGFLRVDLVVA